MTIYILTYNEEVLLSHTIAFYRERHPGCRIIIYDNHSDDSTVRIAGEMGCEVISFDTEGRLSDARYLLIKNHCWKTASSRWVIVADVDEWLDITAAQLKHQENSGVTVIKSEGWNMVNMADNTDIAGIKCGYRNEEVSTFYDKVLLFDRTKIKNINYAIGAHGCRPTGMVKYGYGYRMYHMKFISPDYLVAKYKRYAERMSDMNRQKSWGGQYLHPEEAIRAEFEGVRRLSTQVRP